MFDNIVTLSAVAVASLVTASLFVEEDIVINDFDVPSSMESNGYTTETLIRLQIDEFRKINETAASLVQEIFVGETEFSEGLIPFGDFFNVSI